MRVSVAAISLAALTAALIASAPASAQDNQITCGRFERAVARAASAAALQEVMRVAPSQKDCPATHAQAERKRLSFQGPAALPPQQPAIVRSPPAPPPRDVEADVFAAADTCAEMRDYQQRYRNGRFRAQAQAFLNSETCNPRPTQPAPRAAVIEPEMVRIPGGSFVMGSPAGETGSGTDEGPQRTVTIQAFEAGKYEVTFAEWDACVADSGCGGYRPRDEGWGRGSRPVINVSWNDAQTYVQWLSRRTGKTYRLLTEAEWEYAALAGTSTPWSWGSDQNAACTYANLWSRSEANDSTATCSDGSGSKTALVGRFRANSFGIHEMHGNVWEWVQDCYVNTYSGAPTNGAAVTTGGCSSRVFRGGSWNNVYPQGLRSAIRVRNTPTHRDYSLGFRLARAL